MVKIPSSSVGAAEAKDFMCTSLSLPICGVPPLGHVNCQQSSRLTQKLRPSADRAQIDM